MPIVPSHKHPLRRLREVLDLQQKELAAFLKCSTRTIIAIENGTLRLSGDLALRAYFEFGVLPQSITTPIKSDKGYSRKKINAQIPQGVDRKPYSIESKKASNWDGREDFHLVDIFDARGCLDTLLQAAAEKGCFMPAYFSFLEWLDLCQRKFGLTKTAEKIMVDYEPPSLRMLKMLGHQGSGIEDDIFDAESLECRRKWEGGWSSDFVQQALLSDEHLRRQQMWTDAAENGSGAKPRSR
jgi:DNA-binding XRE family transcriptional regulator